MADQTPLIVVFVPKSCLFGFLLLIFLESYREIDTVQCKNLVIETEKYVWGFARCLSQLSNVRYYPQGKQRGVGPVIDTHTLPDDQGCRCMCVGECLSDSYKHWETH